MKIAEKATLRDYIESVDLICENFNNAREFYDNISSVPYFSLQNTAFEKDIDFLNEVSQILSVIVSIISHPHISNKREDIVIRVEQARQLQQDAFRKVLQDSSLWKNHNGKMIPEEVHYYQHVDELRIYENQFIVLLVDLLDVELNKCINFYVQKLPVVDAGANVNVAPLRSSISQENSSIAIKKAEGLKRRIRFIKNTYFYKVVSVGKGISPLIKPTNILLKDRLYRSCFKFYRKFVRYENEFSLKTDLARYSSVIILKALDELGFELVSIQEGKFRVPATTVKKLVKRSGTTLPQNAFSDSGDYEIAVNRAIAPFFNGASFVFELNEFRLQFSYMPNEEAIRLDVCYNGDLEKEVSHALLFDSGEESFEFENADQFLTTDIFSIWNSFVWENNQKRILSGDYTELEMIKNWILSKITVISGDKDVYSKYCPVCKVKGVEIGEHFAECKNCGALYTLPESEGTGKIWVTKIRRV